MNIGWIGLGKLGLPCGLTLAKYGHTVVGTDINPKIREYLLYRTIPYEEQWVHEMFRAGHEIQWVDTIAQAVTNADIVFVAVQTPHAPEYEGVTKTPETTRDFEYCYLREAVKELARVIKKPTAVSIVSTVLPGTTRRELLPYTEHNPNIHLVYSPCFIAMGTAAPDWASPEMVLAGTTSEHAYGKLVEAHRAMHQAPVLRMSIESAELTKVLYNTYISMKIVWANTTMELAHKTGADCDEIVDALALATKRVISPLYMRGGMGDGGGCHPRDNLALSHLANQLGLSTNLFDFLMRARDQQTMWLGTLADEIAKIARLPGRVCGREYKKNSNLTVGSPSRLLVNLLHGDAGWKDKLWQDEEPLAPAVFLIGVNHDKYAQWQWPKGSIVIDPWGYIPDQPDVTVIRIGRKSLR
jgi:UDPglucose 6-dehydrogenase